MTDEAVHYLLLYDYVEDMLERRVPYREEHLARIRVERDAGRIVMAGPLGDPPRGAALVFRDVASSEVEAFARADPYAEAGLITAWRVDLWKVT
jgi:uncharacterized protein YciI